jgi:hypothetical protein
MVARPALTNVTWLPEMVTFVVVEVEYVIAKVEDEVAVNAKTRHPSSPKR